MTAAIGTAVGVSWGKPPRGGISVLAKVGGEEFFHGVGIGAKACAGPREVLAALMTSAPSHGVGGRRRDTSTIWFSLRAQKEPSKSPAGGRGVDVGDRPLSCSTQAERSIPAEVPGGDVQARR